MKYSQLKLICLFQLLRTLIFCSYFKHNFSLVIANYIYYLTNTLMAQMSDNEFAEKRVFS